MLTDFRREFSIYRTLRAMSRQRVAMLLKPGNVWVIEKAVPDNDQTEAELRTCHMRGWIEPIENSVAAGNLTPDGELPKGPLLTKRKPLYRLTDSGWNHIYRANSVALFGAFLAVVGVCLTWK
jgi:hypothetical protein